MNGATSDVMVYIKLPRGIIQPITCIPFKSVYIKTSTLWVMNVYLYFGLQPFLTKYLFNH